MCEMVRRPAARCPPDQQSAPCRSLPRSPRRPSVSDRGFVSYRASTPPAWLAHARLLAASIPKYATALYIRKLATLQPVRSLRPSVQNCGVHLYAIFFPGPVRHGSGRRSLSSRSWKGEGAKRVVKPPTAAGCSPYLRGTAPASSAAMSAASRSRSSLAVPDSKPLPPRRAPRPAGGHEGSGVGAGGGRARV